MNRQNQGKSEKDRRVYTRRKKVRGADEVLKRALAECMQEEADQAQKKLEAEGQHAFSKPFIEKMQFVLKQGKNAEEQQKKKVHGRRWTRVAAACIVCVVVAGGSWIGLRGSFQMSQNETSSSAAKTETAGKEESLELGKTDQGDAASGDVDDSDVQKDGAAASNQEKESSQDQKESEEAADTSGVENGNRQGTMSNEEKSSTTVDAYVQNVDIKVLAVTPTSLRVRLTNNGDEDVSLGDDYEKIEVYDKAADTWTECQKLDEIAYHDILRVVKPGDEQNWYDWYVDWTEVYGSLEAGHYRLQKNISIGNIDGGDQYVQPIQIEFDIR